MKKNTLRLGAAVAEDAWSAERQHTVARIALGRSGVSLPTRQTLAFALDHARARDAVHGELDTQALARELAGHGLPVLQVHSAAPDRACYLQRPDLGRKLAPDARLALQAAAPAGGCDLVLVLGDGLSARAVASHAPRLLEALAPALRGEGWSLGPLVLASQARVALGDEVGVVLGARMLVMLIGERPGLSSPDSLGVYLTAAPRVGLNDAARNCISNVRPEGLSYPLAAYKLMWLLRAAWRDGSGVALKDGSAAEAAYLALQAIEGGQRGGGKPVIC
ncbi:ethanolamine ammonia-lyase subunit EutC [Craterilacuibacter sp. RT1T]|uniref:ethanolamine ammonia-lyase subunit EutC n=1 Tax=Craterilacuibacter sp. RT1T TaxID=2942211 RepID=UPI0020BF1794|nr:ethanolamine ammonia-lyase subunit EutC [Craterilacuibacter sp. RT1T]MCL6262668.1 ethanolamine ammonia-lyase subunit EutC [Craterilacuibacter sp. RT1T]